MESLNAFIDEILEEKTTACSLFLEDTTVAIIPSHANIHVVILGFDAELVFRVHVCVEDKFIVAFVWGVHARDSR